MNTPKLNPEQAAAVKHIDGPMIVLSGPGTGKTQIIAARIAHLLDSTQMDPHNILCLTFTESGVVAMRKRLIEMIGTAAYYVRINTFHSFCNDVIKDFPEKFLSTRELESLTDLERIQIFRKILDNLPSDSPLSPFGSPYFYLKDCTYAVQNLKRENISPENFHNFVNKIEAFLEEHGQVLEQFSQIHGNQLKEEHFTALADRFEGTILSSYFRGIHELDKKGRTKQKNEIKAAYLKIKNSVGKQQALSQVYKKYQSELSSRGRYDYEDMILFVVDAFKHNEELLAHYQEQFQYILVDEYQDTNGAQNEVVRLIAEYFENPNIFVVGDDKQSIYRFQGASLENILFFHNLYKDHVKLVSLKENFRSHQTILDASDSLINFNEHSITKFIPELKQSLLAAKNHNPAKVQLAEFESKQSEHYFLAKRIEELIQNGTEPSEIAILYRNNYEAEPLMELFLRLKIPFRLEAGVNILADQNIQKLIGLLRFIHNLDDGQQLFYLMHSEFLNFAPLDIYKVTRKSSKDRKTLFETLLETDLFKPFAEKCLKWQMQSVNKPIMEFFDIIIKESGYLDHVMKSETKVEELNRLNTLFDEIKALNRSNHAFKLSDLIEYFELLKENDIIIKEQELKTQKNALRLMTTHKSKGLEFEHVFIMNCVDKHWGNKRRYEKLSLPKGLLTNDVDSKTQNEDERRLFYVAMTRAKQSLTLTYAVKNERERPQVPSIFLEEINPECLEKLDTSKIEDEAINRLQTIFLEVPKVDHSEEEANFAKSLLENYTMSVTHLNNYLKCPRLFYYRNLLRVPSAKNKNAAFGSAVHEALKDFSLEHKKGSLPSEDYLIESFEKHMNREVITQQDRRGGLDFGRQTLKDYYNAHEDVFRQNTMPEYDFSSHGVNLNGIPLTGKLDKIEFLNEEAKAVHVVDYKTGNPDSKRQALGQNGEYRRQILFYKLLCDLSPRFPYDMVSGEIDFVQKSKKDGRFRKEVIRPSQSEIEQIKTEITEVYDDIKNLRFLNTDEWSNCGECEYCDFFA